MMRDIVRTIVAGLMIAAVGPSPPLSAALQKSSPAEALSEAAERGRQVLAALRNYTYKKVSPRG